MKTVDIASKTRAASPAANPQAGADNPAGGRPKQDTPEPQSGRGHEGAEGAPAVKICHALFVVGLGDTNNMKDGTFELFHLQ